MRAATNEELDKDTTAGLAHFLAMAIDLTFTDTEKAGLARAKSGRHLLALVEHLKTNSASTYRETQLQNPFMRAARASLLQRLEAVHDELNAAAFRFEPHSPDRWRE